MTGVVNTSGHVYDIRSTATLDLTFDKKIIINNR